MLYPLKFKPVYKDYIWGGRELEKLGKKLPEGIVAESWEISNHPDGESVVSNGEYEGLTISELLKRFQSKLLGKVIYKNNPKRFPLLIKFIDAKDKLSVQVHPNDDYANKYENGEFGKNEMWYIISARPGAKIVYGVKKGVTKESFAAALRENKLEDCLNYTEVSEGDVFNIPAGLIHAIGDGIVLTEIQQNSNLTYRVYDYNRTDANGKQRPLHIEKALAVIDFNNCNISDEKEKSSDQCTGNNTKSILALNQYFCVEKYNINGGAEEEADGSRFYTYTCLEGEGKLLFSNGCESIHKGESVLIPADLGRYKIEGKLQLIKAFVQDSETEANNL